MTKKHIADRYISWKNNLSIADFSSFLSLLNAIDEQNTDPDRDLIFGQNQDDAFAEATAISISEPIPGDDNVVAQSEASGVAIADSIGIDNLDTIATGKGEDIIIGIANSSAQSEITAISTALSFSDDVSNVEADSQSVAQSAALAVGINNSGRIATGRDDDIILGLATADASSTAIAKAKAKSISDNGIAVSANSESIAEVVTVAVGIDNSGKIATARGNDIIVGVGATFGSAEALANAKAILKGNYSDYLPDCDLDNINSPASAESNSLAVASIQTQALGINNTGNIHTGRDNDLILGLAYAENLSNAKAFSKTRSTGDASATATALAIIEGDVVGIVNSGRIATGRGNDTVLGVALNNSVVTSNAKAKARNIANNGSSESNEFSDADDSTIAIGINNSHGVINTARGDDSIIGKGSTIGILGGKIHTGKDDDLIKGYGGSVGIEDTIIRAGAGDDYFQAAKVDFDPLTGDFAFSKNQVGAIANVELRGNKGHDTFEIGGFAGHNLIDGGRDFDVLKLWGDKSEYKITMGSGRRNTLIFETADSSTLTVNRVEEFYFGDSDYAYLAGDLA